MELSHHIILEHFGITKFTLWVENGCKWDIVLFINFNSGVGQNI